jgi:hypothetical protein
MIILDQNLGHRPFCVKVGFCFGAVDLLGFARRRGRFAARSMARHEQLRIAAGAALPLQRYASYGISNVANV